MVRYPQCYRPLKIMALGIRPTEVFVIMSVCYTVEPVCNGHPCGLLIEVGGALGLYFGTYPTGWYIEDDPRTAISTGSTVLRFLSAC